MPPFRPICLLPFQENHKSESGSSTWACDSPGHIMKSLKALYIGAEKCSGSVNLDMAAAFILSAVLSKEGSGVVAIRQLLFYESNRCNALRE